MSASSVAAWPRMLAPHASLIAGLVSYASWLMVPTRQLYSAAVEPSISDARKST